MRNSGVELGGNEIGYGVVFVIRGSSFRSDSLGLGVRLGGAPGFGDGRRYEGRRRRFRLHGHALQRRLEPDRRGRRIAALQALLPIDQRFGRRHSGGLGHIEIEAETRRRRSRFAALAGNAHGRRRPGRGRLGNRRRRLGGLARI